MIFWVMGDLIGDVNLFGELDIGASRSSDYESAEDMPREFCDVKGQGYLPFPEPPREANGQQRLFPGRVLDRGYCTSSRWNGKGRVYERA